MAWNGMIRREFGIRSKKIMDAVEKGREIPSYELKKEAGFGKGGEKNFDGIVTELQMQTYLVTKKFRRKRSKRGAEYGMAVSVYSKPEEIWGYDLVTSAYGEAPDKSWDRISRRMKELYPDAEDKKIKKILKLAGEWIRGMGYDLVKPEHTFGDSRIDFYMEKGEERYLTEVKGCTLADPMRKGAGLFPDASTERGVKHLKELIKASGQGYHCTVLFAIQMNGIHLVFPNSQTQPEFGETLALAANAGVEINYLSCHVDADRIKVTGIVGDTARYRKL